MAKKPAKRDNPQKCQAKTAKGHPCKRNATAIEEDGKRYCHVHDPHGRLVAINSGRDTPANPVGRPKLYSPELASEICLRLTMGETLISICEDEHTPSYMTVMTWIQKNENGFSYDYTQARERQAEYLFDEMQHIADDGRNDFMEKAKQNGETFLALDHEHVQRSKLRIDSRQWRAKVMNRKRFGDTSKVDVNATVEHKNKEPELNLDLLDDDELDEFQRLIAKAQGQVKVVEDPRDKMVECQSGPDQPTS